MDSSWGLSVAGSPLLTNLECRVTDVLIAAFWKHRNTSMWWVLCSWLRSEGCWWPQKLLITHLKDKKKRLVVPCTNTCPVSCECSQHCLTSGESRFGKCMTLLLTAEQVRIQESSWNEMHTTVSCRPVRSVRGFVPKACFRANVNSKIKNGLASIGNPTSLMFFHATPQNIPANLITSKISQGVWNYPNQNDAKALSSITGYHNLMPVLPK